MYYTAGGRRQCEEFTASCRDKFPVQVLERLKEQTGILDDNYGEDRDMEGSLGGYAVLFSGAGPEEDAERKGILEQYHATEDEAEYTEEIVQKDGYSWVEELYILSSDYSIIFYYPVSMEEGVREDDRISDCSVI